MVPISAVASRITSLESPLRCSSGSQRRPTAPQAMLATISPKTINEVSTALKFCPLCPEDAARPVPAPTALRGTLVALSRMPMAVRDMPS